MVADRQLFTVCCCSLSCERHIYEYFAFQYLDRIGQLFFGLPPPQTTAASGGLFGKLPDKGGGALFIILFSVLTSVCVN